MITVEFGTSRVPPRVDPVLTPAQCRAVNEAFFAMLDSDDNEHVQAAVDAVNDFTRAQMQRGPLLDRSIP